MIENYKKIKKLLGFAKQTFLSDKGMEIIPTLDNLVAFEKELNILVNILRELEQELLKTWGT